MVLSFSIVDNRRGRIHVTMLQLTPLEPASQDRVKLWFWISYPDDYFIHPILVRCKTCALDGLHRNDIAVGNCYSYEAE